MQHKNYVFWDATPCGYLRTDVSQRARLLFMVEEHCILGCFHGGISYRCLLGQTNKQTNSVAFSPRANSLYSIAPVRIEV
jgi:hypothetical protein